MDKCFFTIICCICFPTINSNRIRTSLHLDLFCFPYLCFLINKNKSKKRTHLNKLVNPSADSILIFVFTTAVFLKIKTLSETKVVRMEFVKNLGRTAELLSFCYLQFFLFLDDSLAHFAGTTVNPIKLYFEMEEKTVKTNDNVPAKSTFRQNVEMVY